MSNSTRNTISPSFREKHWETYTGVRLNPALCWSPEACRLTTSTILQTYVSLLQCTTSGKGNKHALVYIYKQTMCQTQLILLHLRLLLESWLFRLSLLPAVSLSPALTRFKWRPGRGLQFQICISGLFDRHSFHIDWIELCNCPNCLFARDRAILPLKTFLRAPPRSQSLHLSHRVCCVRGGKLVYLIQRSHMLILLLLLFSLKHTSISEMQRSVNLPRDRHLCISVSAFDMHGFFDFKAEAIWHNPTQQIDMLH